MKSTQKSQVPNAVSGSTGQDWNPSNSEFATAVLATAFAIHSLEEARTPQNKNEKGTLLQPSTIEVTLSNETKSAGETSTVQDPEENGTFNLGSDSSFVEPTPAAVSRRKVKRLQRLKSFLALANVMTQRAEPKIERKMGQLQRSRRIHYQNKGYEDSKVEENKYKHNMFA